MKFIFQIGGKGKRFLDKADQNPEFYKQKPIINVKGKIKGYGSFNKLIVDVANRYFEKYGEHHTAQIMEYLYKSIINVQEDTVNIDMKSFEQLKNRILQRKFER